MSAYTQSAKRQKVKEGKAETDIFQGIDKVEFNNMASPNEATSYRYYNCSERIHNKTMEEWLKLSISYTDFRTTVSDQYSRPTPRPWDDNTNTMENYKRSLKALFELCTKLGIKYWTAFDTDLIPWSDNWDEMRASWDEMAEYVAELTQKYHVKLLWLAPDLHSHPRYSSGTFTSNDASTFLQAATQIKKCMEMSQRLNAECFLLWPYREGYCAVFLTDVHREIKLFAKLLKITAEYKDRLNYRCQMIIMPYYNFGNHHNTWQHSPWGDTDMIKSYMWDVTSCLYFLKSYNLDRYYNVCTPPGHHMYMANVYNMLGGVVIPNCADACDNRTLTLMMKCIFDQGSPPPGGVSLKLRPRGADVRDVTAAYVQFADGAARALRRAVAVAVCQTLPKHVQQRYATYHSGVGSRLVSSDVSMEDCEEYYKKSQSQHSENASSKCEQMELLFQRYIDTSENI